MSDDKPKIRLNAAELTVTLVAGPPQPDLGLMLNQPMGVTQDQFNRIHEAFARMGWILDVN